MVGSWQHANHCQSVSYVVVVKGDNSISYDIDIKTCCDVHNNKDDEQHKC